MRFLQLVAMGIIAAVGIRWAIREGSKPPENEDRQLILGYTEEGEPIMSDDDCDIDGTMALWRDLHRKARNC
jgi:hypothetical protein